MYTVYEMPFITMDKWMEFYIFHSLLAQTLQSSSREPGNDKDTVVNRIIENMIGENVTIFKPSDLYLNRNER